MTFQEQMTIKKAADAQGAFNEKGNPNIKLVINNEEEPSSRDVAIRRITERKWAKDISQSERPVIVITESYARPNASYAMMRRALPNVPVVFENETAKINFTKGCFCDREILYRTCVGHFERVSDYHFGSDDGLCKDIKTSDCVMVFGTPKGDLQKALDRHGDYFINHTDAPATSPRINFSLIETMERKISDWNAWTKRLVQPRSL